jgi:putative transposase
MRVTRVFIHNFNFVTFSRERRQPKFDTPDNCDLFVLCLKEMRLRFAMRIYGYVVMPEHVHLLVSEPDRPVSQVRVRTLDASPSQKGKSPP